jgi:hypothetical protein
MRRHIHGIDHVVIAVSDLDAARDAFGRMGFAVTPRGFHSLGSQNHCMMFGDDYVELLAVPTPHPATRHFSEFLAAGDGLAALALKTDSAKGAYTELLWAGFDPSDPVDFSRPVALSGRAGSEPREAKFRIVNLAPDKTPGARVFVCEHFTRDLVWRPAYCEHANGAVGLAAVALVATDVAAAASPYARLFDTRADPIAEGLLVGTGDASIAVATEQSLARRLRGVELSARPAPAIAALFIRVADRERAAAALAAGGMAPVHLPDGSVAVGADRGHGVALVFG